MSATTYRYLFADLLTNSILGELPLTNPPQDNKFYAWQEKTLSWLQIPDPR